jgi:prepilin-type N-terminal cleavage/methylation domain-containing protein
MERRFQIYRVVSEILRRAAATDGMTLVELLVAILILAIGILATFTVFDSSKRTTHVSELLESQNQVAQRELERVESLPYEEISLTAVPPTSTDAKNPGYYVGSASCPTFTWNQSPGATQSDPLVINSCTTPAGVGVVSPTDSTDYQGYTVYDFITWVTDTSGICGSVGGCPVANNYKRVTIEVCASGGCTSTPTSTAVRLTPTTPVLVSGIVADPHAAPNIAGLNTSTPLVTCSPLIPPSTPCNYGLNGATANVFYLTDSRWGTGTTPTGSTTSGSASVSGLSSTSGISTGMYISGSGIPVGTTVSSISGTTITISQAATATATGVALTIGPYSPPTADNGCMHYTEALVPATCGGTAQACTTSVTTGCPTPDLLNAAAPPASIPQEYNFSPNPASVRPPGGQGRVIKRDSNANATSCAVAPTNDATSGEFWATQPLTSALTLNGNGGLTIYTGTLTGVALNVTLCIGIYEEVPATGNILDPLNALGAAHSTLLGAVGYTNGGSWPAAVTPLSFSFNYMASSQTIPAGDSLGVRIWVTNNAGDDILIQYDAPSAASGVELDSQ